MPSRWGPRKPGQSAAVSAPAGAGGRTAAGGASRWLAAGRWPRAVSREPAAAYRSRRERRRLVAGLGQEPFLGSLRPPPGEVVMEVAGDAAGPEERPPSAREQDGRDHRRAPRSVREATGGHRPGDEGEAQDRDGVDGEHHPHHPRRNRLVDDARCREQRDDHQDDGAQALGPGCPAEEHPPHDDSQRATESANHPDDQRVGNDDGDDKPEQPQQHSGDDAGPQPERFPRSRFVGLCDGHIRPISSSSGTLCRSQDAKQDDREKSGAQAFTYCPPNALVRERCRQAFTRWYQLNPWHHTTISPIFGRGGKSFACVRNH